MPQVATNNEEEGRYDDGNQCEPVTGRQADDVTLSVASSHSANDNVVGLLFVQCVRFCPI